MYGILWINKTVDHISDMPICSRSPRKTTSTFNPRRLLCDEGVSDDLRDARVGAAGEDPGPGGLGGLQQTLPKAPVEADPEFM